MCYCSKMPHHCKTQDIREKAFRICRDYLNGSWKQITAQEMELNRISGGLSNWLYMCALPSSHLPKSSEPAKVLLRMYGQVHDSRDKSGLEAIITESVIFALLSERHLGPSLYGVFPGGRLEEYIPARPLKTRELQDPELSRLIANKMAIVHAMNIPINKEPRWLWKTMGRWMKNIQENLRSAQVAKEHKRYWNKLLEIPLAAELEWLRKVLPRVRSPVVFCHNDFQEGNILLREDEDGDPEERIVVIDFEYCSYNYRGFDLANHFCEWMYDYTLQTPPHYTVNRKNYPNVEQQLHFIRSYLNALEQEEQHGNDVLLYDNTDNQGGVFLTPPHHSSCDVGAVSSEEESLLQEVLIFTLASHFFWGLWSIVNAQVSEIPFGYWEYAQIRLDSYFHHKKYIMETLLSSDILKRPNNIHSD